MSLRVRRETVFEQSVQLLRAQILERRMAPGTPLTEEALAREMGISRATVREVLNTLTMEGLLSRHPTTRVLHVTRLGRDEIREIYRARELLEAGAVRAFAKRADASIDGLRRATDALVAASLRPDGDDVVSCDIACHVETVALAGSRDLTDFYTVLLAKLQLAMTVVTRSGRYDTHALADDHVTFVNLLERGDFDAAEAHVSERLRKAEASLLAIAE